MKILNRIKLIILFGDFSTSSIKSILKNLKNNMMNEIGKNKIELKKVNFIVLKFLKRFKISVFEYLL